MKNVFESTLWSYLLGFLETFWYPSIYIYIWINEAYRHIPPNGKRNIIFKYTLGGDMLVPQRVDHNTSTLLLSSGSTQSETAEGISSGASRKVEPQMARMVVQHHFSIIFCCPFHLLLMVQKSGDHHLGYIKGSSTNLNWLAGFLNHQ